MPFDFVATTSLNRARKHHVVRGICPGARDGGTRGLCRNCKRRSGPVCGGGWSLRHRPTDQLRRDDWLRRLQPGPEPGWRHLLLAVPNGRDAGRRRDWLPLTRTSGKRSGARCLESGVVTAGARSYLCDADPGFSAGRMHCMSEYHWSCGGLMARCGATWLQREAPCAISRLRIVEIYGQTLLAPI